MSAPANETPIVAVTIKTELFNALGNYLSERPWSEVNHLLVGLQNSQPVFGEPNTEPGHGPEPEGAEVEPARPAAKAAKAKR